MAEFTTEQIVFIYKTLKNSMDKLQDSWPVKFKPREKAIIRKISDTILDLPRKFGGN